MRIGAVPYLNGKPLIYGLDNEPEVEIIYEVPSRLANMLEKNELAAGLVSSAACFMNPCLQIVPGISISCDGPAESVKIFHKGKIEDIHKVALDTSSLTGVLLAKIVLRERYNLSPEYVQMPPSLPEMLKKYDAAVVIGDTTMCTPRHKDWYELDLGEEWHLLTGLPFVFAIWAVNPDMANPDLVEILLRAKERGLDSLDEISKSEAERLGLPIKTCHRYLSEIMNYDLTERHIQGLKLFYEKASEYIR